MNWKWVLYPMVGLFIGGCALNRDLLLLNDKIDRLERELTHRQDAMQSDTENSLARHEEDFRVRHAELRVRLERLRDELRTVTGQLEEIEHIVRGRGAMGDGASGERTARIDAMEEMLNAGLQRIMGIEAYIGLETTETIAAGAVSEIEPVAPADLDDHEIYASGRRHFTLGHMEDARRDFAKLLERFPASKYAGNAQFWIGETFYQEKWYEKAILEYQKVIDHHPDGNKLQGALLKQGFAFHMLGENANARLLLRELIRKYPGSSEAVIAEKKLREIN